MCSAYSDRQRTTISVCTGIRTRSVSEDGPRPRIGLVWCQGGQSMSNGTAPRRDDLMRQARVYVESCGAAGIEWLPLGDLAEQVQDTAGPAPASTATPPIQKQE